MTKTLTSTFKPGEASHFPLSRLLNKIDRDRFFRYAPAGAVIYITDSGPAPAWYSMRTRDIGINAGDVFTDDGAEALGWLSGREFYPVHLAAAPESVRVVVGLLQHEQAHGAWSDWMTKVKFKSPAHLAVAQGLEEIRIEARAVSSMPIVRIGIRSAFRRLINVDGKASTKFELAYAWLLSFGRVATTIIERDEVASIDLVVRTALGDDVVDQLTNLLDEAVALPLEAGGGLDRMHAICDEWLELVGTPPTTFVLMLEVPEGFTISDEADSSGPPSEVIQIPGDGDEPTKAPDCSYEPDDERDDEDDELWVPGGSQLGEQDAVPEDWEDPTEDLEPDWLDDEDAADMLNRAIDDLGAVIEEEYDKKLPVSMASPAEMASKVFKIRKTPLKTGSHKWTTRQPTSEELKAAASLGRHLQTMSYHAPDIVEIPSQLPPGRLRSRDAVRVSAERAQGRMSTASPWTKRKRRHSHQAPLTIGIATDVSGSMRWAEQFVASAAFVIGNAGTRISARTAAVTFGGKVEAVIRPGTPPADVRVRAANDGEEKFDQAIAALDGVLHFTRTRVGAKVLVVVSDGHFVRTGEKERMRVWGERLEKANVALVWITPHRGFAKYPPNAHVIEVDAGATFTTYMAPLVHAIETALQANVF